MGRFGRRFGTFFILYTYSQVTTIKREYPSGCCESELLAALAVFLARGVPHCERSRFVGLG